jgi:hypothetical protein
MAKDSGKMEVDVAVTEPILILNADQILQTVKHRLAELRPAVAEYNELVQADQALSKLK